jgi:hypothetical protein
MARFPLQRRDRRAVVLFGASFAAYKPREDNLEKAVDRRYPIALALMMLLAAPAEAAAQRWTFCVAWAPGAKDVWLTDVFPAALDRLPRRRPMPAARRRQTERRQRAERRRGVQPQDRRGAAHGLGAGVSAQAVRQRSRHPFSAAVR